MMRHVARASAWSVAALVVLALLPAAARGEASSFDRWYVLTLQGQRAGWAHVSSGPAEGGAAVDTVSDMRMSVKRGGMTISIAVQSRFRETAGGEPVSAEQEMKLGAMATRQAMRFSEGGAKATLTSEQMGQARTQEVALEKGWLPPHAASREMERQLAAGAEEVKVKTLDPSMGPQVIEVAMKVVGEENVEVMGKVVPAKVVEATVSALPGVVTRSYVDDAGQPWRTTVALMPGMELEMLAADEAVAKAKLDAPELLAQTLIEPAAGSVALGDARALRRAVYRVTVAPRGGAGAADGAKVQVPSTGAQRVKWLDDRTAEVTVDLDAAAVDEAGPGPEHRAASAAVNGSDPQVVKLRDAALGGLPPDADDAAKAEALRRHVHGFIDAKDLSVGFATAGEVARTGQGDCTEHAVLLAALLRSAGIPSRTVTGLVYVDEFAGRRGVFGYHMWTQAWLPGGGGGGGRWVDLDATLPVPFDATHLALSTSALADGSMLNDLVTMTPLMGRLTIQVAAAGSGAGGAAAGGSRPGGSERP